MCYVFTLNCVNKSGLKNALKLWCKALLHGVKVKKNMVSVKTECCMCLILRIRYVFYEYNMVLGGFDLFVVKIILFLILWFGYFKNVCIAC